MMIASGFLTDVVFWIFGLITTLVNVILSPIENIILNFLPSIGAALSYFSGFVNYVISFFPFLSSWLNVPSWFYEFLSGYIIYRLTVPIAIYSLKLAIRWYDALKL